MTQKDSPIEDLRAGSDVFSADGEKLGKLYAIVIDPRTNKVTNLAIDAGPHFPEPGFGNPRIVSVEIEHLRSAGGDSVELDVTAAAFRGLSLYEHEHFFAVPGAEAPGDTGTPRLWNVGVTLAAALAGLGTGLAVPAEHFARASFERHILDDAPVWRRDPSSHIGDVERVLVDEDDRIIALVIKRGVIFHHEVVLPMKYVKEVRDGAIMAEISDADLKRLKPFSE